MKFTESEESRRHGVQIQWTNNEEQDAVTELTGQTSNDDLKLPSTSTKPAEISLSTTQSSSLTSNAAVTGDKNNPLEVPDDQNLLQNEDDGDTNNNTNNDSSSKNSTSHSDDDSSSSSDEEDPDADPNPDDPQRFNGYDIDHNAEKIMLHWIKGYDDESTRLHNFGVRPCKQFLVEMKAKMNEYHS